MNEENNMKEKNDNIHMGMKTNKTRRNNRNKNHRQERKTNKN
jgi:hypothetical protein